jgi:alpha-tubulin suppressor-like RCC1 family protein
MKILLAFGCFLLLLFTARADQTLPAGVLWGMGSTGSGQLGGLGGNLEGGSINVPAEIITSNVTAVAAGYFHSLWIESDGSLWGLGTETSGQLGNGTFGPGNGYTTVPVEIQSNGVIAVSAGYDFSLFLRSDGTLWGMGDEEAGELGDGTYGTYAGNYATNVPV